MMRFQITISTTIILLTILSAACGGNTNTTNTATNANTTANVNAVKNANNSLATSKTPEEATTNQADTIKPVVMAYYNALKKKDDAALRKVYSAATLKSLEKDMQEEGAKSLVQFITELEPAPDQPFEVRNEQIQGDRAVAEVRGGAYPNGFKFVFVKENGEWKITNEVPNFQPNETKK